MLNLLVDERVYLITVVLDGDQDVLVHALLFVQAWLVANLKGRAFVEAFKVNLQILRNVIDVAQLVGHICAEGLQRAVLLRHE